MKKGTTALYKAMNKYGIDNFIFSILEECPVEKLDEREIFWISQLNSYLKGYNMTRGGQESCSIGENNPRTKLTDADVLIARKRVHLGNEYPKDVYEDYKDLVSYDSFWQMIHGHTWKNVDCSMIKKIEVDNHGSKNPKAKLKEEDVIEMRRRKYILGESTLHIYLDYQDRISFSAFEKAILGST